IESEDKRFYTHPGFDVIAIIRATYNNIKARGFVQGGSTITQQLAKNMYFSFEKTLERKVGELLMALKMERELTKNEIMELYINIIYFGEECYGIKEAARHYYNVDVNKLDLKQMKILVETIKSPSAFNPNNKITSEDHSLFVFIYVTYF
ncbi:MAG: biosynthetic peptidoglycan transglycosylase, partial [Erysipelotrichaceae bacterium]